MKTTILTATFALCLGLFTVKSNNTNYHKPKFDSLSCLQVEGKVLNADEGADETCIVELISLDDGIDTLILKEGKRKFRFVLNRNSYYAIRLSKKGYISKLICVNTEMLTEGDGIHKFAFETNLIKEAAITRLNKDLLDFPVAIIHFDYEMDDFSYNKGYTENLKRELHETKQLEKPATKSIASAL